MDYIEKTLNTVDFLRPIDFVGYTDHIGMYSTNRIENLK